MSKNRKSKFGKHTSIPKGLERSIYNLQRFDSVKKTVFGRFGPCSNRFPDGFLEYRRDTLSGIEVNGYLSSGIQKIFVNISPLSRRQEVIQYIEENYPK